MWQCVLKMATVAWFFAIAGAVVSTSSYAQTNAQSIIAITDDLGRQVMLREAPKRIVSLAPHLTELIFAAGLADKLVGVDLNSDYPREAAGKTKVSSYPAPDTEALLRLKPDLIVVWGAGFDMRLLPQWESRGIAVYVSAPKSAAQIQRSLEQFSTWSDNPLAAAKTVTQWRERAQRLSLARSSVKRVSYFLQIADQPLTTLSNQGIWAEASLWCAGDNVFASQTQNAPTTDIESVTNLVPKLWLVAGGKWPSFAMIRQPPMVVGLSDSLIHRPGPRWLDAVEQLCQALDRAR